MAHQWVPLAKVAFEKFFMRKMSKGTTARIRIEVYSHPGIMKLKDQ